MSRTDNYYRTDYSLFSALVSVDNIALLFTSIREKYSKKYLLNVQKVVGILSKIQKLKTNILKVIG